MKHLFLALIASFTFLGLYAEGQSIAYVSVDGNDTNDGTKNSPYKTIKKALISTNENATIIVRGGDYSETVNIAEQAGRQSLTISSYPGELVRLLCGEKVDKAEKVSGKVLKTSVKTGSSAAHYRVFQHDVADQSTLISPEERHPLHRGKLYRCNSTPLVKVASIAEIESKDVPAFFYDESSKALYFSIAEGTDLSINPIYLPTSKGLYGGNDVIKLNLTGIEMLYAGFNLTSCSGAKIVDCAAKYAFAGGGFIYNMSVGIEFIRCESARTFTGTGNGDGFNGHSRVISTNHPDAKHTTVLLVDCWAHDNYDDGYSNHERCEGVVRGGLFEYNQKYGIGSGYGAHETVYGAISRFNTRYGFAICADVYENEGGYASQMILHNCISEGNQTAGYLAYTSNDTSVNPSSMILYDCYSINNKVGFEVRDRTLLRLINCKDSGSETLYKGTPTLIKSIDNLR